MMVVGYVTFGALFGSGRTLTRITVVKSPCRT